MNALELLQTGEDAYEKRQYSDAEGYFRQALTLFEEAGDKEHQAEALNNLAATLRQLDKDNEAEPFFQQLVPLCRDCLGSKSPDLAIVLNNVGAFFLDQNNYSMAEPYYDEARSILELEVNKGHAGYIIILDALSRIYELTGRAIEAAQLTQEVAALKKPQTSSGSISESFKIESES